MAWGWRHGKLSMLGVAMAMSLLAATWFQISVAGMPVNVRTATAIIFLTAFTFHSPRLIFSPLTLIDCVVACLVLWHMVVDAYFGEPVFWTFAAAYGEWVLPYAAGRYAMLHRDALSELSPWFVGVGAFLACAACLEACLGINFWESLFTKVDGEVLRSSGKRFGIYRAIAATRHPLFLGTAFLLLIPWAMSLIDSSSNNPKRRHAGVLGLVAILIGLVATVSRGPLVGLICGGVFLLTIKSRVARWMALVLVLVGAVLVVASHDEILQFVDISTKGEDRPIGWIVDVNGEARHFTGPRNRLLILELYGPIVLRGGAFGYGTENSSGFPPKNIPGLPNDIKAREQLGIVDNSYLNMGLRFGCVGFALLVALLMITTATALRLTRVAGTYFYPNGPATLFAFAAIVVAYAVEIGTVFFHYDHRFLLLFTVGVIAGLQSQYRILRRGL